LPLCGQGPVGALVLGIRRSELFVELRVPGMESWTLESECGSPWI